MLAVIPRWAASRIDGSTADSGKVDTIDPTSITVVTHSGLAVDAARDAGARFIVRGLRNAGDFEIEQQMALTNYSVTGIRTVYLPCGTDRGFISSRFVREIALYGGAIDHLVPGPVAAALSARFSRRTASAGSDG